MKINTLWIFETQDGLYWRNPFLLSFKQLVLWTSVQPAHSLLISTQNRSFEILLHALLFKHFCFKILVPLLVKFYWHFGVVFSPYQASMKLIPFYVAAALLKHAVSGYDTIMDCWWTGFLGCESEYYLLCWRIWLQAYRSNYFSAGGMRLKAYVCSCDY